jgi:hypothetical protein
MARWYAKGREVMAKISANGAHEIARIRVASPAGYPYLWVMCSDGRVLTRATGELGDGYTVAYRGLRRNLRTREALLRIAQIRGYRVL